MYALPGIERQAVTATPPGVLIDRDERVLIFPAGPDRGNQRAEARIARREGHGLQDQPAEAMPLPVPLHLGGKRRHRGRRRLLRYRPQAHGVDPRGQVVQRSVPPERYRPAAPDDAFDGTVIDEHLKPRELREKLPEVLTAVVAMQVVLWPDAAEA